MKVNIDIFEGTLYNTDEGWRVINNSNSFPIMPKDKKYCKEGKKVGFTIIRSMSYGNGLSIGDYAKIINK